MASLPAAAPGFLAPLALAAALLLSACGGGGGGGGTGFIDPPLPNCPSGTTRQGGLCVAPRPEPPTACTSSQIKAGQHCVTLSRTPPSVQTSLNHLNTLTGFVHQPALKAVNAHYALGMLDQNSYTGNGVLVAVVDSGIQHHEVFLDATSNTAARLTRRVHEVEYVGPNLVGNRTISVSPTPLQDDLASCERANGRRTFANLQRWRTEATHCLWGSDHGTAVASVLAANKPDSLIGMAPKADLVDIPFFRFMEAYCVREGVFGQCDILARNEVQIPIFASVFGAVADLNPKPRFVNASLISYRYLPEGLPANPADQRKLREWFVWLGGEVFWEEAQDTANGAVYVFAAGNDYQAPRSDYVTGYFNGLRQGQCMIPGTCGTASTASNPANNPYINGLLPLVPQWMGTDKVPHGSDLSPAMLVAVSVDVGMDGTPGTISRFSNRCGAAAAWCIAAPGGHISGTNTPAMKYAQGNDDGPTVGYAGNVGTSFATPMVVGAMALVDEAFRTADGSPQVSPQDVRRRILDTANRNAPYNNPAIYGQGLLDVQAALTPQGAMSMPSPPRLGGGVGPLHGAGVSAAGLGLALPQAAVRGLAGGRIMVLDAHSFPFYLDAGRVAYAPSPGPGLSPAALTAGRGGPSYLGNLGISLGEEGHSWGGAMTPEYALDGSSSRYSQLAAGAHLAVSPLVAASLDGGDTRHMAMRLRLGGSTLSAMACSQQPRQRVLSRTLTDASSNCMALGWDYAAGQSFGLSLRAHQLNSGDGLYRYGLRCFGASCGMGGASATELGIGGFAKLAPGLRLGWNYWQGRATDKCRHPRPHRLPQHGPPRRLHRPAGRRRQLEPLPTAAPARHRQHRPHPAQPPHPRPPNPLPHPKL